MAWMFMMHISWKVAQQKCKIVCYIHVGITYNICLQRFYIGTYIDAFYVSTKKFKEI